MIARNGPALSSSGERPTLASSYAVCCGGGAQQATGVLQLFGNIDSAAYSDTADCHRR